MQFQDEVVIETDAETTWELVSDPEVLVESVPGAKEVTRVSDDEYKGTIERGIAGITVALEGEVAMTELNPPSHLTAEASGEDSNTGSRLDADAEMDMTDEGDSTTLAYEIDMEFTGRLATVGSRLLKRMIRKDINTFFENIKNRAEEAEAQATVED
ncbi:CoxG family protein [Natrarchaeobius chitinivorans]|nr:carbon monoxide dehydrogenase subunit G [Natrarchaeobius chitinivorans]